MARIKLSQKISPTWFKERRYYSGEPIDLRVMTHQGKGEPSYEKISWWWYTEDDMAFDTIGWQTINRKKYLMCG